MDDATIEDYFYDLEILVVLSRDQDGNRFLRVQETVSANASVILDVRWPEGLQEIGTAKVKFTVVKPVSLNDDEYILIASLTTQDDSLYALVKYKFRARQTTIKTQPDAYQVFDEDEACVDYLRARGDIIVTLCQ